MKNHNDIARDYRDLHQTFSYNDHKMLLWFELLATLNNINVLTIVDSVAYTIAKSALAQYK